MRMMVGRVIRQIEVWRQGQPFLVQSGGGRMRVADHACAASGTVPIGACVRAAGTRGDSCRIAPVRAFPVAGWLLGAFLLVLGLLSFLPATVQAQQPRPVPALSDPVMDTVGMLDAGQRQALSDKLRALDRDKGSQVAVLIVDTTQPEAIEQYSIRVAEAWKLGRGKGNPRSDGKAVDDGVLLLVARDDRRIRIEVGYGLEGAIPDGMAARIIDQQMRPRFRQSDWYGGINAAVDSIIARINGEELPLPSQRSTKRPPASAIDLMLEDGLSLMFFCLVGGVIVSHIVGRVLGPLLAGAGAGFILFTELGVLLVAVAGGIIVALGVLILRATSHSSGNMRRMGRHSYRGGAAGGSGGGFGGGGGGGFSGGGGGFGGGGASGGW